MGHRKAEKIAYIHSLEHLIFAKTQNVTMNTLLTNLLLNLLTKMSNALNLFCKIYWCYRILNARVAVHSHVHPLTSASVGWSTCCIYSKANFVSCTYYCDI